MNEIFLQKRLTACSFLLASGLEHLLGIFSSTHHRLLLLKETKRHHPVTPVEIYQSESSFHSLPWVKSTKITHNGSQIDLQLSKFCLIRIQSREKEVVTPISYECLPIGPTTDVSLLTRHRVRSGHPNHHGARTCP